MTTIEQRILDLAELAEEDARLLEIAGENAEPVEAPHSIASRLRALGTYGKAMARVVEAARVAADYQGPDDARERLEAVLAALDSLQTEEK